MLANKLYKKKKDKIDILLYGDHFYDKNLKKEVRIEGLMDLLIKHRPDDEFYFKLYMKILEDAIREKDQFYFSDDPYMFKRDMKVLGLDADKVKGMIEKIWLTNKRKRSKLKKAIN